MTEQIMSDKKLSRVGSFISSGSAATQICKTEEQPRKISEKQKSKLISLITTENQSMKHAANMVGISYSTAKKVFSRFRASLRQEDIKTACLHLRSLWIETSDSLNMPAVQIITTVAGLSQMVPEEDQLEPKSSVSNSSS